MAGPTTEVFNDDIRSLRDEVHRADLDVRELNTQAKVIIAAIKILGVFAMASLLSGVWWGSSLTTKVDGLGVRIDKLESRFDKLEAKVDGLESRFDKLEARFDKLEARVNERFDGLEASIAKLIELSKTATKP